MPATFTHNPESIESTESTELQLHCSHVDSCAFVLWVACFRRPKFHIPGYGGKNKNWNFVTLQRAVVGFHHCYYLFSVDWSGGGKEKTFQNWLSQLRWDFVIVQSSSMYCLSTQGVGLQEGQRLGESLLPQHFEDQKSSTKRDDIKEL